MAYITPNSWYNQYLNPAMPPPQIMNFEYQQYLAQMQYEAQKHKPKHGELVVVYDTFKEGHRNHNLLIPNKFNILQNAARVDGFIIGEKDYGTPIAMEAAGHIMYGDLYDMSPENIQIYSIFREGLTRRKVNVSSFGGVVLANMWISPYDPEIWVLMDGLWTIDRENEYRRELLR